MPWERIDSYIIIYFILLGIMFGVTNTNAQTETLELIKEGKAVAIATALWQDDFPQETKDRLFKLTILINLSLSGLSGDYSLEGKFEDFKNRIRITVVDTLSRDAYALWIIKTDIGKELRIAGNNVDNTERAVYLFLKRYLKLKDKTIKDLEVLVNEMTEQQESLTPAEIKKISFKRVNNLTFEQDGMEIRSPSK